MKNLNNKPMLTYFTNNFVINTFSKYFNRCYGKVTATKEYKQVGRIKSFPSANKEWKDSVYTYNKNYMRSLLVKDNLTNKLIKNHFNMSDQKDIARSLRMRSLIRKSSTKKLFVSKPEIKQNNDKVIITVYIYDREKQSYIRNLFFHDRKFSLYNLWLTNNYDKKINFNNIIRKRKNMFKKKLKRHLPYYGINYTNEMDFLKYKTLNLHKKLFYLNKMFMYLFISHVLTVFNMKILFPINFMSKDKTMIRKQNHNLIKNLLNKKPEIIFWIDSKSNMLKMVKKNDINENLLNVIISEHMINDEQEMLNKQEILINYMSRFIEYKFIETQLMNNKDMNYLYNNFKRNYYKALISEIFGKTSKWLYYYTRLELNKLKFSNLLTNLKVLITRIYNKKTELNIVNLKYINLNSDIYTQAIVTKLKKKVGLLKVLRKSLKLVRLPYDFFLMKEKDKLNIYQDLNLYKSLSINNLPLNEVKQNKSITKDLLNILFERLFPYNLINRNYIDGGIDKDKYLNNTGSKAISVLNTIKYKWVTGVRLEAAGRLTRRNTASRSVFKFRYKGNLKNNQYYVELNQLKTMPTVMLRNYVKGNSQYTLINSRRRIGSFGIKSWISSY